MRQKILAAAFLPWLVLTGCGNGSSVTGSGMSSSAGDRTVSLVLQIGEHRDIELPAVPDTLYSVSSRALATATGYNGSLSCTPSLSIGEIGTAENSVAYGIVHAAPSVRPVLRLIGVYGQDTEKEIVCIETKNASTGAVSYLKVEVTVVGSDDGDIIDGSPIDPDDPGDGGDGGGDGGSNPPPIPEPNDPGEKPTYDPQACVTAGFYRVEDDWHTTEGKFGPDSMAYIRSRMAGNVNSLVELFYPALSTVPTTPSYVNLGRYNFTATSAGGVTVEFDLQMATALFGLTDKKYFYIRSNGYCMRGQIPTSQLTPPSKSLVWVSSTSL
ncbi:MAG: hypothetical protein AB7E49_01325 [Campylobacterales bacterium]